MDGQVFLDDDVPLALDAPFTRGQANAAGISDNRLKQLTDAGLLRRPVRNAYVAAQLPDTLDLRAAILRLVVPPDCFFCDHTAGWLHGAPNALLPGDHLVPPRVACFRPADHGRLRNEITRSGERTVRSSDLMELRGLVVTTPIRTAWDLGRLQRRDQALSGMDAMLRLGLFSHEELLVGVERFKRQRGVVQLRWLAPLADGRAESPGESALRLRWYDAGLPRPDLQIPVGIEGREVFRLDLGLEELLFAAEYDGHEWHTSPAQRERDAFRRGWLAEERGWAIEAYDASHVYGLRQDADVRLRIAFRTARATYGRRTFIASLTPTRRRGGGNSRRLGGQSSISRDGVSPSQVRSTRDGSSR